MAFMVSFAMVVGFGLCSCTNDGIPGDIRDVWNSYETALRAGDEPAARSLWTEESARFCELLTGDSLRNRESTYSLIKVDKHDAYVRLQVLEEWGEMQMAHFFYLVRPADKYLFQYPFILFANDWPTVKTTHFTFHLRPSADELFATQNGSATPLDTLPYERYVSRLLQLTGLDLQQPIDYYLCDDTSQVSLLAGLKNAFRITIGSCSITTRANDFSEIAGIVLRRQTGPIEFLRIGLCGSGESERVLSENTPSATMSNYSFCAKYLSRLTPDTLDILFDLETADLTLYRRLYTMRKNVAGTLVYEMIRRDSANQFAALYRGSRTGDDFNRLFLSVYGEQPYSMLKAVNQRYTEYINKNGPTLQNPGKAGSH